MSTSVNSPYAFIIDTEDYAGNFERALCAYITGRVGECGVGSDMAEIFCKEMGIEPFENVVEEADEHGCSRPTTIYPTPGWFNHGMGGHFRYGDEEAALEDYRKQVHKDGYNSLWHRYLKEWREKPDRHATYARSGWSEEKLAKAAADKEKEADERIAKKKLNKWPAYLSVAILFGDKPTDDQIRIMKGRAHQFVALPKKTYGGPPMGQRISKITGFRLIANKKTTTEESI